MPSFFRRFRDFFLPLNGAQKTLFGVFSVGILLLIGLLFYWALKPNYVLLYGSLAPESAQQIVEELQGPGSEL